MVPGSGQVGQAPVTDRVSTYELSEIKRLGWGPQFRPERKKGHEILRRSQIATSLSFPHIQVPQNVRQLELPLRGLSAENTT
jgi:hypothetical protein